MFKNMRKKIVKDKVYLILNNKIVGSYPIFADFIIKNKRRDYK